MAKKPTAAELAKAKADEEAARKAALEGEDGSDGASTEDWNDDDTDNKDASDDGDGSSGGTLDLTEIVGTEGATPPAVYPTHEDDTSGSSLGGSSGASIKATDAPEPAEDDRSDVQRVEIVQAAPKEPEASAGLALTPGQLAGLDPIDRDKDTEQAQDRAHRTNMQTDHELENGLDPTSSGPNAGVTPNASYTAAATGAPPSDMSGRPPLPASDKVALDVMRQALDEARSKDRDAGNVEDARIGWRTPMEIGVSGGVMKRLQSIYPDRIEMEEVPNGHFFPETGARYRLA